MPLPVCMLRYLGWLMAERFDQFLVCDFGTGEFDLCKKNASKAVLFFTTDRSWFDFWNVCGRIAWRMVYFWNIFLCIGTCDVSDFLLYVGEILQERCTDNCTNCSSIFVCGSGNAIHPD